MRADTLPLDLPVAVALREAGRRVYVLTDGGNLVNETVERYGSLRLVRSRHAEHLCPRPENVAPLVQEQLELFDHESVRPPAHRSEGQR